MEDPRYWDRLTASLAVVELKDLSAVWGFLAHAGVIEHTRRGAFEQVLSAVTRELEQPQPSQSAAAKVATALRGLQTPRGAQLDPEGAETRAAYDAWRAKRC
jgi:hypothetical protein